MKKISETQQAKMFEYKYKIKKNYTYQVLVRQLENIERGRVLINISMGFLFGKIL